MVFRGQIQEESHQNADFAEEFLFVLFSYNINLEIPIKKNMKKSQIYWFYKESFDKNCINGLSHVFLVYFAFDFRDYSIDNGQASIINVTRITFHLHTLPNTQTYDIISKFIIKRCN